MRCLYLSPLLLFIFCCPSFAQWKTMPKNTYPVSSGYKANSFTDINYKGTYNVYSYHSGYPALHTVEGDTAKHNFYGNLINDDSMYNKRSPFWVPAVEVIGIDFATVALDRYILKADYAMISLKSWEYNFRKGWEWDVDGFGINFFGHPYSGSLTFSAARSTGYNYYQSTGFSFGGSVIYEYLGENTRPSYNDVINTPINGALIGEILYRISSNILDDTKVGGERVGREILAGILDPARGLNRLLQGKTSRVTPHEVYQKEPANYTLYAGIHNSADGPSASLQSLGMLNLQIDYGNPFEPRKRKPFDFFRLRTDFDFGGKYAVMDNIGGYGVLYGQNVQMKTNVSLIGIFQHYDYWHNLYFEMASTAFGVGAVTKFPITPKINLFTSAHAAIAPLAGNAITYGLDTSAFKRYHYGGGVEAKLEGTLNLGKLASISFLGYYFWTHTYVGAPQFNNLAILRPRLTVRIFDGLSCGIENYTYINGEEFPNGKPSIHLQRVEQKIFLLYFFENPKRYEHYN